MAKKSGWLKVVVVLVAMLMACTQAWAVTNNTLELGSIGIPRDATKNLARWDIASDHGDLSGGMRNYVVNYNTGTYLGLGDRFSSFSAAQLRDVNFYTSTVWLINLGSYLGGKWNNNDSMRYSTNGGFDLASVDTMTLDNTITPTYPSPTVNDHDGDSTTKLDDSWELQYSMHLNNYYPSTGNLTFSASGKYIKAVDGDVDFSALFQTGRLLGIDNHGIGSSAATSNGIVKIVGFDNSSGTYGCVSGKYCAILIENASDATRSLENVVANESSKRALLTSLAFNNWTGTYKDKPSGYAEYDSLKLHNLHFDDTGVLMGEITSNTGASEVDWTEQRFDIFTYSDCPTCRIQILPGSQPESVANSNAITCHLASITSSTLSLDNCDAEMTTIHDVDAVITIVDDNTFTAEYFSQVVEMAYFAHQQTSEAVYVLQESFSIPKHVTGIMFGDDVQAGDLQSYDRAERFYSVVKAFIHAVNDRNDITNLSGDSVENYELVNLNWTGRDVIAEAPNFLAEQTSTKIKENTMALVGGANGKYRNWDLTPTLNTLAIYAHYTQRFNEIQGDNSGGDQTARFERQNLISNTFFGLNYYNKRLFFTPQLGYFDWYESTVKRMPQSDYESSYDSMNPLDKTRAYMFPDGQHVLFTFYMSLASGASKYLFYDIADSGYTMFDSSDSVDLDDSDADQDGTGNDAPPFIQTSHDYSGTAENSALERHYAFLQLGWEASNMVNFPNYIMNRPDYANTLAYWQAPPIARVSKMPKYEAFNPNAKQYSTLAISYSGGTWKITDTDTTHDFTDLFQVDDTFIVRGSVTCDTDDSAKFTVTAVTATEIQFNKESGTCAAAAAGDEVKLKNFGHTGDTARAGYIYNSLYPVADVYGRPTSHFTMYHGTHDATTMDYLEDWTDNATGFTTLDWTTMFTTGDTIMVYNSRLTAYNGIRTIHAVEKSGGVNRIWLTGTSVFDTQENSSKISTTNNHTIRYQNNYYTTKIKKKVDYNNPLYETASGSTTSFVGGNNTLTTDDDVDYVAEGFTAGMRVYVTGSDISTNNVTLTLADVGTQWLQFTSAITSDSDADGKVKVRHVANNFYTGGSDCTFSSHTITCTGANFSDRRYYPGQKIYVSGSVSNNGWWTISRGGVRSDDATKLIVDETLTTESTGVSARITGPGHAWYYGNPSATWTASPTNTLYASTVNFWNYGFVPGMPVYISSCKTAGNNGKKIISAINSAGTTITFDSGDSISNSSGSDDFYIQFSPTYHDLIYVNFWDQTSTTEKSWIFTHPGAMLKTGTMADAFDSSIYNLDNECSALYLWSANSINSQAKVSGSFAGTSLKVTEDKPTILICIKPDDSGSGYYGTPASDNSNWDLTDLYHPQTHTTDWRNAMRTRLGTDSQWSSTNLSSGTLIAAAHVLGGLSEPSECGTQTKSGYQSNYWLGNGSAPHNHLSNGSDDCGGDSAIYDYSEAQSSIRYIEEYKREQMYSSPAGAIHGYSDGPVTGSIHPIYDNSKTTIPLVGFDYGDQGCVAGTRDIANFEYLFKDWNFYFRYDDSKVPSSSYDLHQPHFYSWGGTGSAVNSSGTLYYEDANATDYTVPAGDDFTDFGSSGYVEVEGFTNDVGETYNGIKSLTTGSSTTQLKISGSDFATSDTSGRFMSILMQPTAAQDHPFVNYLHRWHDCTEKGQYPIYGSSRISFSYTGGSTPACSTNVIGTCSKWWIGSYMVNFSKVFSVDQYIRAMGSSDPTNNDTRWKIVGLDQMPEGDYAGQYRIYLDTTVGVHPNKRSVGDDVMIYYAND